MVPANVQSNNVRGRQRGHRAEFVACALRQAFLDMYSYQPHYENGHQGRGGGALRNPQQGGQAHNHIPAF